MNIVFPSEACYLFVRDGRIVVNGNNLSSPLTSNEAVVLNCGYYIADFVNASPHDVTEVLAIHLHPDILREIFRNELPDFVHTDVDPILPSKVITNSVLERFIESLTFYFDNPDIVTNDILVLKVRELILLLVQSTHAESIHKLITSLFSRKNVTIGEVIKTHLYGNFSISELAKFSGLSLTSFKNEFVSLYGESPGRYIRKKKIERAKELLLTDHLSVNEVADQVGYKDVSHFSKSFQSITGITPTSFRSNFKVKL
ncbi:helix-turn-helix domain-containing protein [Pseudochryseolinea flava]|uniref:AraC family transcriptional regulator n=1 Tax=Pseudochryseolinea flava TaxID=2059302 RepID=A0A364Y446_9BACT|nr:AraC family transcriptional regulator [Pseudochryseolinea flava]RAW01536.1 AraC family transcriptional regulator [Pseudochryseolinea flava]